MSESRSIAEKLQQQGAEARTIRLGPPPGEERPTGDRLAHFLGAREIARGGMGKILRALEPNTNREVALKVMQVADQGEGALQTFLAEGQITAQLEHPNIVPVHEVGLTPEGEIYFSMKLVRGLSLEQLLADERRQGGADRRPLGRQLIDFLKVCDAVAFAHDRGVIHRDLKPANVMLGEFGEVLVVDWGLAKVLGGPDTAVAVQTSDAVLGERASGRPVLTRAGEVLGTPQYMAPEQARGDVRAIDPRSDIYALGAILYELLTLSPPFEGISADAVLGAVREGRLEPPSRRAPGLEVPRELEAVVTKAMALEPADRYQTVEALQQDVNAWLEGRVLGAAQYTRLELAFKWVARHKLGVLITTAALAGLLAFGGVTLYRARRYQELRRAAQTAFAAEQWTNALVASRRARDLRADPELERLGNQCLVRLARREGRRQGMVDQAQAQERAARAAERSALEMVRVIQHLSRVEKAAAMVWGMQHVESSPIAKATRRLERLLTELEACAVRKPYDGLVETWLTLGVGWQRLGQLERAELALRRAIGLDSKHGRARFELGRVLCQRASVRLGLGLKSEWPRLLSTGRSQLARAAPWADARQVDRALLKAWLLFASGSPELKQFCEQAGEQLRIAMGAEELLVLRALGGEEVRRVPELLAGAMRFRPNDPYLCFLRGVALTWNQQADAALEQLDQGIRLAPALPWLHAARGQLLFGAGRNEPGAAALNRAVQLAPSRWLYWYLLGSHMARAGMPGARRRLEQALSRAPERWRARIRAQLSR